jgi:hypothetical protein
MRTLGQRRLGQGCGDSHAAERTQWDIESSGSTDGFCFGSILTQAIGYRGRRPATARSPTAADQPTGGVTGMRGSRTVEELIEDIAELRAELERYRNAANMALEQLDWCIEILHERASQRGIARSLAKNRAAIRRGLR